MILLQNRKSISLWIAKCAAAATAVALTAILIFTVAAPAAGAATLQAPSGTSLVGYWKLDEGAGTKANDSSGFRNAGTLTNSPTWTTGKLGKALSFNGTTQYIDTGRQFLSGSDDFTIGAWIKSGGSQNTYAVPLSQGHTFSLTGLAFQVGYPVVDEMSFIYGDGASWRAIGFGYLPRTDYTWHYLSVTKSGNTITTYKDGVLQSTNSAFSLTYGSSNFSIGRDTVNTDSNHRSWNGSIDDVRIYNRAFSAAEIATLYRSTATVVKAPTGTGLVGYWKMDEGTGTKANDSSGLGNSGTLIGSPTWTTGKLGKALSFNGACQYITTGANSITGTSAYTLSAWMKGSGGSGGYGAALAIGNGAIGESAYIGWVTTAQVGTGNSFGGGGYGRNFGSGITDQTRYHHVVLTSSGGSTQTITLYVDGVQTNQNAETFNIASNARKIGAFDDSGVPNYCWNGSIDDVRIYNRALSATEISALYKSTATVVNAPTNNSLTSGLIGLWSFDGKDMNWGTGTAYDRSGAGNNGSLISMSTTTSPAIGRIGQALRFNGVNDYVKASSFMSGLTTFSVSVWVKTTQSSTPTNDYDSPAIFGTNQGGGISQDFMMLNRTGNFYWYDEFGAGGNSFSSGVSISDNKWHHIVAVRNVTTLTFYIDGVSVGTDTTGSNGVRNDWEGIGYAPWSGGGVSQYFNGAIDDVRIYSRTLSATEVKALYNLGR